MRIRRRSFVVLLFLSLGLGFSFSPRAYSSTTSAILEPYDCSIYPGGVCPSGSGVPGSGGGGGGGASIFTCVNDGPTACSGRAPRCRKCCSYSGDPTCHVVCNGNFGPCNDEIDYPPFCDAGRTGCTTGF